MATGKPCPYIRSNSKDADTICTGTKHVRSGLPSTSCPLWVEGLQWAKQIGVRGNFDLDSFDASYQPEAYRIVTEWAQNPQGLVILHSLPGLGKSHLALGAWYSLRRSLKPCYFTSSALFQQLALQASRNDDHGMMTKFVGENLLTCSSSYFEEAAEAKPHKTPVVFDDLGAERTTDTMLDFFERLLNYHDAMILTTNLDMVQITARYQERISSRLQQASHRVWLQGQDWRCLQNSECEHV